MTIQDLFTERCKPDMTDEELKIVFRVVMMCAAYADVLDRHNSGPKEDDRRLIMRATEIIEKQRFPE